MKKRKKNYENNNICNKLYYYSEIIFKKIFVSFKYERIKFKNNSIYRNINISCW